MRSIIKHIIYSPRSSSSRRRNRVRERERLLRDMNTRFECMCGWVVVDGEWMDGENAHFNDPPASFIQSDSVEHQQKKKWNKAKQTLLLLGTKTPFHSAGEQRCCWCSCYSSSSSCTSVEPCRQTKDTGTFGLSPVRSSSCSCRDSIKYFVCRLIHFWAIWFRFNKATFKWPLCGQGESTTAPDKTRQAK